MRRITACIVVVFALAIASPSRGGEQRVSVRVSPTMALEPAVLTIRTTIEPSDDNRLLSVSLNSEDYSTTSDFPLEGRSGARLNVLQLRDVPSGLYEVRAVILGSLGPIASTSRLVKIQPAPGRNR